MNIEVARQELPMWLAQTEPPVRIYEGKFRSDDAVRVYSGEGGNGNNRAEDNRSKTRETGIHLSAKQRVKLDGFWKRYAILVVLVLAIPLYTLMVCSITAAVVRKNTTTEVTEHLTHEWRGNMQAYTEQQEQQRMASQLLTGDASLQAQKKEDAEYLAKLIGKYKTKRMKQTVICNAWARVKSGNYPNTVKAVVSQANQFQFWDESNPVKADDRELAMQILDDLYAGRYPAGFDDRFIYGEWSENDYVLRDTWEKNSNTVYWRYPE